LRVLLVDDHQLFRAGLESLCMAWGHEVIGTASDGMEALEKARALRPDLVLMDINMSKLTGLEATRVIKAEMPEIKIIIVTVSDEQADLFEAVKSGAEGYLLKNMSEDDFRRALDAVATGEPALSPGSRCTSCTFSAGYHVETATARPAITERRPKAHAGADGSSIAISLQPDELEHTGVSHEKLLTSSQPIAL